MGAFDDLIPSSDGVEKGIFDDLIPSGESAAGAFSDLIPKEAISEGPVMGTLKAIPRVVAHTAASMVQMPISGLAAGAKLITSGGDLNAANQALEENQRVLDEAYLTNPEERAASENINLAMKPFQMAGKGLKEIIRLTPGKDTILEPIAETIGEASAMFGAGGAVRAVKGRIPSDLNAMKIVDQPTLRPVAVPDEIMSMRGKLVGEPYTPAEKVTLRPPPVESLPGASERSALPYPDYAGEGFTFRDAVDMPDLLRRDGKPFQSEVGVRAAIKREGVTGYEVVEVDGGYVARAVEAKGKEFRPEAEPEKGGLSDLDVVAGTEKQPAVSIPDAPVPPERVNTLTPEPTQKETLKGTSEAGPEAQAAPVIQTPEESLAGFKTFLETGPDMITITAQKGDILSRHPHIADDLNKAIIDHHGSKPEKPVGPVVQPQPNTSIPAAEVSPAGVQVSAPAITPTQEIIQPGAKLDRRVDLSQRKKVSEMTTEERGQALLSDHLTGLKNKRAYEETERQPVQTSIDVDGLKYVNDTFGHDAGNELLKKVGGALNRAGGNVYHFHGDEFALEGKTPEEISSVVEKAREILKAEPLDFNGQKYTPGFSHGIGPTMTEAETLMQKNKTERRVLKQAAERGQAPITAGGVSPVIEVPVEKIKISKDVPQFKGEANEKGIVPGQELQGKEYRRTPMNAIVLWERTNGDLEVVTGRHRLDLAKRLKEKTIPAQIMKESEGFTKQNALTFDAEQNILDNQGTEKDYATYFRNTGTIIQEDARLRGLLRGEKATSAFVLAKSSTNQTFDSYRRGDLRFKEAVAIAKASPANEQLQLAGRSFVNKHPKSTPLEIENYIKAVSQFKPTIKTEQGDLFGFDDTAIRAAEEQAKKATAIQNGLEKDSRTINAALKGEGKLELTNEAAKQYGIIDRNSREQLVEARKKVLAEIGRWEKWYVDPELVAKLKGEESVLERARKTPDAKTAEIPGATAKDTFDLSNPETEIGKLTPQDRGPQTKGFDFGSERGAMPLSPDSEIYRGAFTLKKTIENLPEMARTAVGPQGSIRRAAQGFSEALNSPEVVLGRDPKGSEIYKTLDRADQAKNAFLSTEGQAFTKALGKIKADTEEAARVGQALDGKIKPSELNLTERHLHDFLKERFDFLIHKAARYFAGSEDAYLKIVKLAQEEHPRQMKIEELAPERKAQYERLTADLQKVRGGKRLDELSPIERGDYYEIRQKQRDSLHEEFLKSLPENERQAYDLLKRQIKNYLPHILDPEILLTDFKQEAAHISERLKTATDPGTITKDKTRVRELEEAIIKLQNGRLVTYEALPKNVRFKFFETRKGKAGYSFDAVKAYQAYLNGIARKIFDEPAVRHSAELYGDLDPSLKDYTKGYLRRYMGWDRSKLDPLAGAIASFQWIRTLGFNPRSAITNLTQRLNTVAELPLKYSIIGERMAFTKEGKALFDKTGIVKEVPHVLMEGAGPESLERIRTIAGYMFNKVELGNRKHAFLSAYAYIKDKTPGISENAAIDYATGIVHKTQFRYGRVGMPKIMTTPAGRVGLQYWSYPIKQIELMARWARREPMKLIKFLAVAEGTGYGLKQFLDTDLSNAIGIGVNWAEALEAVKSLSNADVRGMFRHSRLAVTGGGGILPSGLGPTASGAIKIADKIQEGRGFEQFKKEISPVVWRRVVQAYDAVKGKRDDLYPIKNDDGKIMYFLKGRQLIQRTIGPMTATEKEEYLDSRREALLEQERTGVLHEISAAIVDGDQEKVKALVGKYQIVPSDQMIENEALDRITTRRERRTKVGARERYQFQREGRLVRP